MGFFLIEKYYDEIETYVVDLIIMTFSPDSWFSFSREALKFSKRIKVISSSLRSTAKVLGLHKSVEPELCKVNIM